MARSLVGSLSRFRLRAGARPFRDDRPSRRYRRLRGPARRSASRCDARADRRHCRHSDRPGGDQGNDQRKNGLYRPQRRSRGDGDGNRAAAVERIVIDEALRKTAAHVLDVFRARGLKLATAESCTGGLVAASLTDIAGSSDVVDRGFVTYSNAAKKAMLGVPASTLAAYGAVSPQTAAAMATGALVHAGGDVAVAVTGVAAPGAGAAEKPVGLVHLAAAARGGRLTERERRYGDIGRAEVR